MWMPFAVALVVLNLGFASEARASGLAHRASCTVVRFYVAKYTAPAAEAWARSKGATEAEIEVRPALSQRLVDPNRSSFPRCSKLKVAATHC